MSVASSRAPSPRTCRWCRRRNSSWSSMPRLPEPSASMCRRRCSPTPTRSSSEPSRPHHPARRRSGVAARGAPQQGERMRRIGVLVALAADDSAGQARLAAFVQSVQELGWTDGRNVRIDTRWAAGDAERFRRYAAELVALAPDVILASGGTGVGALLQVSRTVPIVFTQTLDPVGTGYVDSLARPGGNATGFTSMEYGLSGKYLELLKEIAPHLARAAVLRDATIPQGIGSFGAIQAVAPSLGVELRPIDVHDAPEIERAVTAFARTAGSEGGWCRPNPFSGTPYGTGYTWSGPKR